MAKTKKTAAAAKSSKMTRAKKIEVDWSDEDSVKAAMAEALGYDVEDLEIEEDSGLSSFGEGDIYRVSSGQKEWMVAENSDVSSALAVAVVKQDLEESPENFQPNFIQSHIDMDHLRKELYSDVFDMKLEDLQEEAKRKPLKFFEENSIEMPSPSESEMKKYAAAMCDDDVPGDEARIFAGLVDMYPEDQWSEMGEEPEVPDREIEKAAEEATEAALKHPVQYLEDIYGEEDAAKKAIEIGGIDIDAAADEVVSTDGEGHFLSHYDGHMHDGPGGIVYWRVN